MKMRIVEVIEAKVLQNSKTGQRVSPYGAAPWQSESERAEWALVTTGYTWQLDNGRIGLCRLPAKTREEAESVMREHNARCSR
jgi:hypothetical protein